MVEKSVEASDFSSLKTGNEIETYVNETVL